MARTIWPGSKPRRGNRREWPESGPAQHGGGRCVAPRGRIIGSAIRSPGRDLGMQLSSIPQIYRNFHRWTEILAVLSKFGLADWIQRLGFDFAKDLLRDGQGEALARASWEQRLRMALVDLGPTFIKLGQILSTRPDIVGAALANELKSLQADVPADDPATVREIVELELGQPLEDLFLEFDLTPIASASIGQVHRATLPSGERVVVKVQHANIASKVREDLEILAGLATLAERLPDLEPYRPVDTVGEFQRMLRRELDFGREERNLQQFAGAFADDPRVVVPQPISDLCTPRVLTMEILEGVKLTERGQLLAAGFDLEEIARTGAELYLHMIFELGHFHADPHPGNLILLPGDRIGLLDFGMVGRLDQRLREEIEELLMSVVHGDGEHVANLVMRIGRTPPDLDLPAFRTDVEDFVTTWSQQPIERFDLSGALNEMTELIRQYQIMLPPQVGMLIKTLIVLEGTAQLLSPNFSLIEIMQPMERQIFLRRLDPRRHLRKLQRFVGDLEQLAEVMPRRLLEILEQIRVGKFDIHLDHRRLGPSVNRLVTGLLASAIFVGSAHMLSQEVPPLLFHGWETKIWFGLEDVSILGLTGLGVSILIALRLFWAILQSGNLDREQ